MCRDPSHRPNQPVKRVAARPPPGRQPAAHLPLAAYALDQACTVKALVNSAASGRSPDRIALLAPGPEPRRRHILPLMPDRPPDAVWLKLGAEPGLCEACKHAKLNETRRGTAYLRCTRAAWDTTLPRYPRLPVTQCAGFERREG
jgi:hypothetical protein